MSILIREYAPGDYERLVDLMTALQHHITELDPLNRQFTTREGQQKYIDQYVLKDHAAGIIKVFVAESEGKVIGFVSGYVKQQSEKEKLWTIPSVIGRVDELCVDESVRSGGVGTMLMEEIEKYFKSQGCTVVVLGVFAPNTRAHNFYLKRGYNNRYIDLLKPL